MFVRGLYMEGNLRCEIDWLARPTWNNGKTLELL